MRKPIKQKKAKKRDTLPKDINQRAHELVRRSTEEAEEEAPPTDSDIRRVMVVLGRKGGKIGGKRRAERLTPEERSDAASKAAIARWHSTQPES